MTFPKASFHPRHFIKLSHDRCRSVVAKKNYSLVMICGGGGEVSNAVIDGSEKARSKTTRVVFSPTPSATHYRRNRDSLRTGWRGASQ